MSLSTITPRSTKYCRAIELIVKNFGHATNQEIHAALRLKYPKVSLTTVHRVTTRLFLRGRIAQAPTTSDGSLRYDANLSEHDHFICAQCGGVRDINTAPQTIDILEEALGGCRVTGRLVIYGSCQKCEITKLKE